MILIRINDIEDYIPSNKNAVVEFILILIGYTQKIVE